MSSRASPSAPRSAGATTPQNPQPREYSCALCKKRKVRCDRADPCSVCVEAEMECISSVRAPYRRRKRQHSETERNRPGASSDSVQQARAKNSGHTHDDPVPESRGAGIPGFGQNLWTGLNDEFRDPRGTKASPEDASHVSVSASDSLFSVPTAFLFAASPNDVDLRESHPPPVHAFMLWQTFTQNVNPLSKLIYAPSVQTLVLEASRDFDSISRASAALVFSIYAAAVTSMKNHECQSTMGESRKSLLTRYLTATQQAMAAAGFLKSLNLVVLQAFTIYLLSARQLYDPHSTWLLTGIAVRMGQRIKLHIDRESKSFSIFETQIRRRVWWQILLIDSRSGQLSGAQSFLIPDAFHFLLPANSNDADLNPDMTEEPVVYNGPTEMIFCLLRYEFGRFLNASGKKLQSHAISLAEKDKLIDELENHLECNFLRYCDPAIPLHLLSIGGARSGICKMRLMAHHPCQYPDNGALMPRSEHDMLFSTSLKMVEYDVLGQSTKILENFSWHLDVYFQLDAFVFMLIESRSQPSSPLADKAWHLTSEIYKYHGELIEDETKELHAAVAELTLSAWEAREADFARRDEKPPATPLFILTLQSQRLGRINGGQNNLGPTANAVPKDFEAQTTVEQETEPTIVHMAQDSTYQENMIQMDDGYYGAVEDGTSGWDSMDWDYWNKMLESNAGMVQQIGSL